MPQPGLAAGSSSAGYDYRCQQSRATLVKEQGRLAEYDAGGFAMVGPVGDNFR